MKLNVIIEKDRHPELYEELSYVSQRGRSEHLRGLAMMAAYTIHIAKVMVATSQYSAITPPPPPVREFDTIFERGHASIRLGVTIDEGRHPDLYQDLSQISESGRAERIRMLALFGIRMTDIGLAMQQAGITSSTQIVSPVITEDSASKRDGLLSSFGLD